MGEMNKILLWFSMKYHGDWDQIYNAVERKDKIDLNQIDDNDENNKIKFMTIIDDNYPNNFKKIFMPPILLYYVGNIKWINEDHKIVSFIGSLSKTDILKLNPNDCIITLVYNEKNLKLVNDLKLSTYRFILIDDNGLNKDKLINIKKSKNLLYLTEIPENDYGSEWNSQEINRLIYGICYKSIIISEHYKFLNDYVKISKFNGSEMFSLKNNLANKISDIIKIDDISELFNAKIQPSL